MSASPAQPPPGGNPPGASPPQGLVGAPAVDQTLQRGVAVAAGGEPLIRAEGLVKHFPIQRGLLQRKVGAVQAVDGVDLEVRRGETLGIVGETGCGKSTTARLMMRLLDVTAGRVIFDGEDITDGQGQAPEGTAARDGDDLPGPLLVAEPAQDGGLDHRRAVSRSTGC